MTKKEIPCPGCGVMTCRHGTCTNPECSRAGHQCLECVEHAVFQAAAQRRKDRGIKLKQFRIDCEANAAKSLNEMWNSWVVVFESKEKAVDYLIGTMVEASKRLIAALEAQDKPKKKVKWVRTSAKRQS